VNSKWSRISLVVFGFLFVSLSFLPISPASVEAQGFSGSDCQSYQCPQLQNQNLLDDTGHTDANCPPGVQERDNNFYCEYESDDGVTKLRNAIPVPPQLRQLEMWFVRLLYALWALSGIFFTFVLIWIGFQYMTSFGNEVALAEVIKKFRNWMIGLGLVFLSYPVLNTFFRMLPIDQSQSCYADLSLPGFQFFFPNACGTVVDSYEACQKDCEILRDEGWIAPYNNCLTGCDELYLE